MGLDVKDVVRFFKLISKSHACLYQDESNGTAWLKASLTLLFIIKLVITNHCKILLNGIIYSGRFVKGNFWAELVKK